MQAYQRPIQGVGIGLRHQHIPYILENQPNVPWFEILGDNYFSGGIALEHVLSIRQNYPITIHTVGLSLGSANGLDKNYIEQLQHLVARVQPAWISDHLAWTNFGQQHFHELLPLAQTRQSIDSVVQNIVQLQDLFNLPFLLENVSSYCAFTESQFYEWEFFQEVVIKSNCKMLLDVNNIVVSAHNHGFDPLCYLEHIDPNIVQEIHLAGYKDMGHYYIDTHGEAIHPPVWQLYQQAIELFPNTPTLIEWDNDIPDFNVLMQEAEKAKYYAAALV